MGEISERYRKVAGRFSERAAEVPEEAWDNPAPCDGWVARDVVRHMVEWMPGFLFGGAGLDVPELPPVDAGPAASWQALTDAIQAALEEPDVATREFDMRVGRYTVENAVDTFILGDVLVHTWDLARAAGLDESLDADEVHRMVDSMEPYDEALRQSGHYDARVHVGADADEQTRLLAFTGRQP